MEGRSRASLLLCVWQRGKHPSFPVGAVIPNDINSGCTPYDGEWGVVSYKVSRPPCKIPELW